MSSFEERTLKGTLAGFISFIVNVFHSILLVPLFLNYWGDIKYGLFISIYAFIQLLRTLDTGHQTYVGNQFNLYYHTDKNKAYKILASSVVIAFLIGFIEFLVFLLIWQFGIEMTGLDIGKDLDLFIGISCMLVMWWLVGSIGGILVKAVMAKGMFTQATIFAIIIKIVEIVLIVTAILTKMSLASLFIVMAITNFIFSIVVLFWVYRRMPDYFPWWKGWNIGIGFNNFLRSSVLTINGFLEQFNSTGLIYLVSHFLSMAMVPVFTTLRTLSNTMNMVTNVIIQPLVPELIRFHSEDNKIKIVRVIQANWFFSGLIVNVGFLLLIPVAEQLYGIWTNHHLELNRSLFHLMLLGVVLFNYGRAMTSYLMGINDLKAVSIIIWVRTVIIFGVSILLMNKLGIVSIGIGILISELICSVVLPNYFVKPHFRGELMELKILLYYTIPLIIMAFTIYFVHYFQEFRYPICLISLLLILYCYYRQWSILDTIVRKKLVGLFYHYKFKYLNH